MSHVEDMLQLELGPSYSPTTKQYTVLTPVKAVARIRFGNWSEEKRVTRELANGRQEHFVILSKLLPVPEAPRTVTQKVKEIIRGHRPHSR